MPAHFENNCTLIIFTPGQVTECTGWRERGNAVSSCTYGIMPTFRIDVDIWQLNPQPQLILLTPVQLPLANRCYVRVVDPTDSDWAAPGVGTANVAFRPSQASALAAAASGSCQLRQMARLAGCESFFSTLYIVNDCKRAEWSWDSRETDELHTI